MKKLLKEIEPHVILYRCTSTGIAWIENGKAGIGHSAHPNIHSSGSVSGMKNLGYWDKKDKTVRSHGFIYNISVKVMSDKFDKIAGNFCQCTTCSN